MLQLIRRAFCALATGHSWAGFYARDYPSREILVQHCAHCGATRRTFTGKP